MRPPAIFRVALYARVSTRDRQDTERQLAELREFAGRQGWTVADEFIDRASGTLGTDQRPEFARLFRLASRRKFEIVLFWSLDRFSREGARATLNHLNRLEQCGVRYRSYTQPFFDTAGPFREALISILAALASQERQQNRERVRSGMARARRRGVTFGRPRKIVDAGKLHKWYTAKRPLSLAEIARKAGISKTTAYRRILAYGKSLATT